MDEANVSSGRDSESTEVSNGAVVIFITGLFTVIGIIQIVRHLIMDKKDENSKASHETETSEDIKSNNEQPESLERSHEPSGVNIRMVFISGIGLFVLIGIVLLGLWWTFDIFAPTQARLGLEPHVLPAPEIETEQLAEEPHWVAPARDLQKLLDKQIKELNTYGWINKEAGTVRIPIDRAMEIIVERGLPVRGKGTRKKGDNKDERADR